MQQSNKEFKNTDPLIERNQVNASGVNAERSSDSKIIKTFLFLWSDCSKEIKILLVKASIDNCNNQTKYSIILTHSLQ